ncbi:MAG TPA: hypothetical protein VFY93_09495 [Planctomycetota bacterium]|nr:hypothetical protein [Planctomycetota bacterium]
MSRGARLGVGRVLAVGFRLWFRRFPVVHLVAGACLAPLVLVPEHGDRIADGTLQGLYGLWVTAWTVAFDIVVGFPGSPRRAVLAYFAQLAVAALLVRDAHAQLAARAGRRSPRALFGIAVYGGVALAAFTALDAAAASLFDGPAPAFLSLAVALLLEALLASWFWLALPAAAVDGFGFLAALARSLRLGRGSRFRVVVPLLLLTVLQTGASVPFGMLGMEQPWLLGVIGVLFLTLKASVLAAIYREICVLKEGLPAEEVGAIFS